MAITAVVLMPTVGATFPDILWLSVILTLALYLMGDLVVLPIFGNVPAVVADAGLAFFLVWLAPFYTAMTDMTVMAALMVAVLVGIAEYVYHSWLQRAVLPGPPTSEGESKAP